MEYKLATLLDSLKELTICSLFIQLPLLFSPKLYKTERHCNGLDIDSTNVFDKMLVLFLFRCNLDPFRYLTVISYHGLYNISSFCYVTHLKLYFPLLISCSIDRFSQLCLKLIHHKEVVTPIIDSAISSGRLFDAKSFVPT